MLLIYIDIFGRNILKKVVRHRQYLKKKNILSWIWKIPYTHWGFTLTTRSSTFFKEFFCLLPRSPEIWVEVKIKLWGLLSLWGLARNSAFFGSHHDVKTFAPLLCVINPQYYAKKSTNPALQWCWLYILVPCYWARKWDVCPEIVGKIGLAVKSSNW